MVSMKRASPKDRAPQSQHGFVQLPKTELHCLAVGGLQANEPNLNGDSSPHMVAFGPQVVEEFSDGITTQRGTCHHPESESGGQ